MMTFPLPNRHGYALEFSPFDGNLLAIVSSKFFGTLGGGTIFLLEVLADDCINEICKFEWTDGLFNLTWSKQNSEVVATSSGDGSLQIWNISHPEKRKPLTCLQEHKKEVYSIDWNSVEWLNQQILSGSWDGSIKLWDSERPGSLRTFVCDDLTPIYCARFSPLIPNIFSAVSINGNLKLWNSLNFSDKPIASIQAHAGEVLTCSWNCFHPFFLATGGSDKLIRIWDIRQLKDFVFECRGNEHVVRKVKFSPFSSTILASTGFDCTTRIWDVTNNVDSGKVINSHMDVVNDVCWNSKRKGQLADCGWDSLVNIYNADYSVIS